jgi:hypothetical protein
MLLGNPGLPELPSPSPRTAVNQATIMPPAELPNATM